MTPEERDQLALRDPETISREIVDRAGPLPRQSRAGLIDDIQLAIGRRDYAMKRKMDSP